MKNIAIVLFVMFAGSSQAQPSTAIRTKTLWDTNWLFSLGHAANAEKDFNYSIGNIFSKSGNGAGTAIANNFVDTGWQQVQLPHDWAVSLPFVYANNFDVQSHGYKPVGGLFPATSIGWYRKHFSVAPSDSGQRFVVEFDGIFRNASIWLNGFYVGNNQSGYVGAAFDITDYLNFRGNNVLIVRADASQYEGWFYEGAGIYRHVWLHTVQPLHIAHQGVFAYAQVKEKQATITVETTIANQAATDAQAMVSVAMLNRAGQVVANSKPQSIAVLQSGAAMVRQQLQVTNPYLWSLDDPYLYRLQITVQANGKTVDQQVQRFGIRTIEVKPDGVFVNGVYTQIKGVNMHQDHAGVGSALPDHLQYYRIGLLKNMGANAYRSSHHAPTPELLDACDSLGMLVMSEQRLLNSSPEYVQQLENLVKRDRNRPSIFMWSIGNEEGWIQTNSYGKRIAQTLLQKLQQWDPTRTATYAADLGNVFTGVNEVIPVRGFNYRESAVADYHRDHPNQPIIGTEMGSTVTTRGIYEKDSIRGYVPDQDITAPWWASTAEKWWKLAANNRYWLGGFIWTGLDYRGEPTPFQWPNINSHFGVMDMCGFPKNIYYYYQSWWTDKDVLHISPHWNWPNKRGQPIEVWVNSNADSVSLWLNNKPLGTKQMPRQSHLKWTVPFEPGELKAIAYKKGRTFTSTQTTTGAPVEVVMTPYKTTMLADGQDLSVINISVVDAAGREVPNADNMIQFHISGPGKIIGVGNGDPSSHEPDQCAEGGWQRRLFNGKCQVLVQGTNEPGFIKFTATATGLWEAGTDIITVSPASVANISLSGKYKLTAAMRQPMPVPKMLGADISFLPELEARGIQFSDKGVAKDAIEILKSHGFNFVRLRIFNQPELDSGYSPKKGYCNLQQTLAMAKRVKAAGMKLLLDFHYSDYWADPGKQYKPQAWKGLAKDALQTALYDFTYQTMLALQQQGTLPEMVQIGNEINHGIVWPDGNVQHLDTLAQLINAGTAAVKTVAPNTVMMLHIALGGQQHESKFFIDNMLARGVHFDVIGESFYPRWHGTLADLEDNLNDLAHRYQKDVIVVEYSQLKEAVNKIAFGVANGRGKGSCIWEPLSTWERITERDGKTNELIELYDIIARQYLQ